MLAIGLFTTAGLLFLGVPMAFALGIIAGLFEFVPVVGPIAAAIPAILIAFSDGPQQALWVLLLYFGVQQIETNILQPLVQNWAVSMPPAIALVAGVGAVLIFGVTGIVFAVPMALVVMTLVGHLYIQDFLNRKYRGPGGTRKED